MVAVGKLQDCLQFGATHLPDQDRHQLLNLAGILPGNLPGNLPGDLVGDLVGIMHGVLPGSFLTNPFMHRQANKKPGPILIAFESRSRRAVFPHGPQNLWHSRRSTLGQVKFLEKFSDSPIAIAAANGLPLLKVFHADGPVGAGKAQDHQFLGGDTHLDGLAPLRSR